MSKASFLFVLTALAACGPGERPWTGTITDSAGVQIVANTAQRLWPDGAQWTLVEELRIGTIDEEPEYQFGQIAWLTPGSDGRIYVFDSQGQHVKVFSPDGTYERTIGGPGSGPGEIGQPQGGQGFVFVGPGDTVFVPDLSNQRVDRWAPDGTEAGSFRLNLEQGFPVSWQAAPNGAIAEQTRHLNFAGGDDAADPPQDVVLLLTTDGAVSDTVVTFPPGESIKFSGGIPDWTIYTPETAWMMTGTGHVLLGTSDQYRIREYDGSGALIRIITMPYERRLVTERDQRAVLAFFETLFKDQGVPATIAQRLIDNNVHFAEYLPAFGRMVRGPNNTIWVQHVRAASDMSDEQLKAANFIEDIGAPAWDVLDAEGRYLGVVTMPDRFAPRVIVGEKIYGVWRDELDVQYAVVLRIEGTVEE
ncbi:MAG TPA: 6-bladed beta-propeller [Gemmatimonadales bacterium]